MSVYVSLGGGQAAGISGSRGATVATSNGTESPNAGVTVGGKEGGGGGGEERGAEQKANI